MRGYHAYGLHVGSSIPLPIDPLPEPLASEPDVTVRLGAVPAALPDGSGNVIHTAHWQARPGAFLMHIEGVARYLTTGGRDVLVEPLGDDDDVAAFLLGSPFTVLLQQRGVATLHAAAVATGAGAVLLLGRSGIGKSLLSTALVERGWPLLADDMTGVVPDAAGRPVALPEFPRHRLWTHTLDEMGWRGRAQSRARDGTEKHCGTEKHWVQPRRYCAAPLPVRAAFALAADDRPDIDVEPAPSGTAFWLLWNSTHRKRAMDAMGRRPENFRAVTALARHVPMMRVTRPRHPLLLEALAERIEAHLHEAGPAGRNEGRPGRPASRQVEQLPPPGAARISGAPADAGDASGSGIVWLASYPRSGNTWLRAVLTGYLREDGKPASINALTVGSEPHYSHDVFNEYLGLDSADMTNEEIARHLPRFREWLAERLMAPRPLPEQRRRRNEPGFVKTHETYRAPGGAPRFPRTGTAGVVYLVRNPLDVAVSYTHHLDCSLDRTLRRMDNPTAFERRGGLPELMTTWSGHVSSWTRQTDLPVHVARYEDLLSDPYAGFGEIVRFAGLAWDEARLDRAIEHAAFSRLRAQEAESGFAEKPLTAPAFFRAGVAGSWRTVLTPVQVRAVVDAHGEVMERFGYLKEARAFLRGSREPKPH